MPRLLVSVRNAVEAEAALAGGADLIDIKEPANGPLGRAHASIITTVICTLAGRVPVSAACGELEHVFATLPPGLAMAKFGLAGWAGRDWRTAWLSARERLPIGCMPVAVAYADWQSCHAPSPADVAAFTVKHRFGAFLVDTWDKSGGTLLKRLPVNAIVSLVRRCQFAGVPVALAGSLGIAEIDQLRDAQPNWFAVRGAACEHGRNGVVRVEKVRELKLAIADNAHPDAFIAGGSVIVNSRAIRSM